MAKTDTSELQKAASPSSTETKKAKKQKLVVPPIVELTIAFSRSAFILVSILVALISYSAGCDLQNIFVRTMVAMIITGLIMWLISWWVMQVVIDNQLAEQSKKQSDLLPDEGLLKDMKA